MGTGRRALRGRRECWSEACSPGGRHRSCWWWWRLPRLRRGCGCSACRRWAEPARGSPPNRYRAGMTMQPGLPMPAPKKSVLPMIAIACFVVGAVLVGFFVWRIVVTAPQTPQPIESGRVELKEEGLTIYSSVPVLTPPCKAQDADGNDVPLQRETGSETITINGNSWYVVARSEHPVPAGVYGISCADDQASATYAAGPKSSVVAFVLSILGAVCSFLIFAGL